MKIEITIDVDDLDRAVAFYCGGLGLELVERGRDHAQARHEGRTFWLCRFDSGSTRGVERSFERHWTPVHLDFVVDDLDAALARALDAGGRLDGEVRRGEREPLGRCDVANLSDPAGNGVDLIERHPA